MSEEETQLVTLLRNTCRQLVSDVQKALGILDQVGQRAKSFSKEDMAWSILAMEAATTIAEELKKASNRNLTPTRYALAKAIMAMNADDLVLHGHKFSVKARGFSSPPPKTKAPAELETLIQHLKKEGRAVEEETRVSVDGAALQEYCEELLEKGKELPPGVREYNEISVRVFRLKKETA